MPLTEHQLFHLNAILAEANETKNLPIIAKEKWMKSKNIRKYARDDYMSKVIKDVEKIKKNKVFPNLTSDAYIHDYIEKDTKGDFR